MASLVKTRNFVCVEFEGTNNNKFWKAAYYDDGQVLTSWGRVGRQQGEKWRSEEGAEKKIREKTRASNSPDKLYTEVMTAEGEVTVDTKGKPTGDLKSIAKSQIRHNNPIVADLLDYFTKVNAHQILKQTGGKITFDTSTCQFTTPLGVILPDQVKEARDILVRLAPLVDSSDWEEQTFKTLLKQYLRLVPHDVGMRRIDPQELLPTMQKVSEENDLLDGLETSFLDISSGKTTKKKTKKADAPQIFDVQLHLVDDNKVIDRMRQKYKKTRKDQHVCAHLGVHQVFTVKISTMKSEFDNDGRKLKGKVEELWHGTKASNILSILKVGMYIPPSSAAQCTGRMFGNGVYFAPSSTKALNYAYGYWGGSGRYDDNCFMFLADVAVGNPHVPSSSSWSMTPPKGYDSVWAKPGRSGVSNDEVIVYRTSQCNLVYLIKFTPGGK